MEWNSFIQVAEASLQRIPCFRNGIELSDEDNLTWKATLIMWALQAADLKQQSNLRAPNQLLQFLLVVVKMDVGFVGTALKDLALIFRKYSQDWRVLDYTQFKREYRQYNPGMLLSPIRDYVTDYLAHPTSQSLRVILQWLCFATRITLETGFEEDSSEFVERDSQLGNLQFCDTWKELKDILNPLASEFHIDQDNFLNYVKFSNGSNSDVSRRLGLWGKWRLSRGFSLKNLDILSPLLQDDEECPPIWLNAHCKLKFVPKGIDSKRAICEEPAANMSLQQSVLHFIDDWFQQNTTIRRYIQLHDQSLQRERARRASVNLKAATLDLSAASDSVSWRLVTYVFDGTELLYWLDRTRTSDVLLPEGRLYHMNKCAPMGSALCFPTECLIFLGICLLACKRCGVCFRGGVYGDDLVVPAEAEEETVSLLQLFGFTPNEKKSFFSHERFKEACGGEYMDGDDVAPVYIPRKFRLSSSPDKAASRLAGFSDLANRFFKAGLYWPRRYLISRIILPEFPDVLFSDDENKGILSVAPTNFHLKVRRNKDLQRNEFRAISIVDEGESIFDDDVRLKETYRQLIRTKRSHLSDPDDLINVTLRTPRLRLKHRWCES